MFFRALTMFVFPKSLNLAELELLLEDCKLRPVGPLELSSRGFISPFGREAEALAHRVGDAIWLTVGGEDKVLPASVVDAELQVRLDAIYQREGRRPGGRARQRMKEDVMHELLARAFVKPSRIDAMIDLQLGVIAVDAQGRKAAEGVVSEVRRALGSFPALPLNAEVAPRSVLTGWVAGNPLPEGLSLGEDCTLQDPREGGATVKCYRIELASQEVHEHLAAGRVATRVSLVLDDHVAFDLDEDLIIRKLRFLDGAIDQLENTEHDDLRAELDARFALMAGEVRRLFLVLQRALRISQVEG